MEEFGFQIVKVRWKRSGRLREVCKVNVSYTSVKKIGVGVKHKSRAVAAIASF
jgi:hypothetical protein